MVENNTNYIDFSFLDVKEKTYNYSVLIILNRPILKEQYLELKGKIDYIICADGAANRMFDNLGEDKYINNLIILFTVNILFRIVL